MFSAQRDAPQMKTPTSSLDMINGKYAVQTKKFEHKFHYYILDIQFKAIDVFVTIDYSGDEIVPTFSVNLHEQEQEYIIKDAINKILKFNQYKTKLQ